MSTQLPQSFYAQMLWKLIDTNWTLTRLVANKLSMIHPAGALPAASPAPEAPASDADVPIEATSPAMQVDDGQVREAEPIIPSFDPIPPGKLGAEIVKIAQQELARPVKEQYLNGTPANFDDEGHIKKYFLEGPLWKSDTWESYKVKHDGIGPAWCAAFASFCWRSVHRGLGVELPLKLNAQCSVLWEQAHEKGLFVAPSVTPAPGDIVFLGSGSSPGHVGIVEKTDSDGIIYIIEGNAGEKTDQLCRSRLIPGKPRYAKLMGFASVEGWSRKRDFLPSVILLSWPSFALGLRACPPLP